MKNSFALLLLVGALDLAVSAPAPAPIPEPVSLASSVELKAVFERAVGDKCKAPQGTGDCRSTSSCKGISYPASLCPKEPQDIQCCVEIKCKAPYGDHYCRSVSNNGCSGGKFNSGNYCPGDNDIQCCVKGASSPEPPSTPPSAPDPNRWPSCQQTLSCTFSEIASASMASRLAYVRYMESNFFDPLNAGNQFRPIEGVITFFERYHLGDPESWVSYVDAGIVEGIQRGGAIALGKTLGTAGNPGSQLWADFLRGMRDGKLNDRSVRSGPSQIVNMLLTQATQEHDLAWSRAEQASTDYGVKKADVKFQRSAKERNWFWMSQLFRLIMRNRPTGLSSLLPWNIVMTKLTDWLTDVTKIKPADCMSEVAWFFSGQLDGVPTMDDVKEGSKIIQKLIVCFKKNS